MKNLIVLFVLLLCVLVLASCSATRKWYAPSPTNDYDNPGKRLDITNKKSEQLHDLAINDTEHVIFGNIRNHMMQIIKYNVQINPSGVPGDTLRHHLNGHENLWLEITRWGTYPSGVGLIEQKMTIPLPGLYAAEPFHITSLTLNNKSWQKGILTNIGDDSLVMFDPSDGYKLMRSGESWLITWPSGVYYAHGRALNDVRGIYGTVSVKVTIDNKKDSGLYYTDPKTGIRHEIGWQTKLPFRWKQNW